MQTLPVELSLGRQAQDTSCQLVRPHFVVAIELEGQPGFVKRRFQHYEHLWIERSIAKSTAKSTAESSAKSTHVPSPEREELESIYVDLLHDMAEIVEPTPPLSP